MVLLQRVLPLGRKHKQTAKIAVGIFVLGVIYLYLSASDIDNNGRRQDENYIQKKKIQVQVNSGPNDKTAIEIRHVHQRPLTSTTNGPRKKKVHMSLSDPFPLPAAPPPLPTCKPPYKPIADFIVLDTLRSCGDWKSYKFEPELELWRYKFSSQCQGRFIAYDDEAAVMVDVILDCKLVTLFPNIRSRKKGSGFLPIELQPGFFKMLCNKPVNQIFRGASENHLNLYVDAIKYLREPMKVDRIIKPFSIAVTRYEFQNIYHTISDIYNAFLVMKFFGITSANKTNVVLLDTHPSTPLDHIYSTVFEEAFHLSDLPTHTQFKTLFWNALGYNSYFLGYSLPRIPYINEFRRFVLLKYGISDHHKLDCKRLRLVLIRRIDDLDLEKNVTRTVVRKIHNEETLLLTIQNKYPWWQVAAIAMETLSFQEQLSLISKTDVLVGMHGAGLTHALFLPSHAGLLEFIPKYWNLADGHFQGIARWRQLKYARWRNNDDKNEVSPVGVSTIIPPEIMLKYLGKMMEMMC